MTVSRGSRKNYNPVPSPQSPVPSPQSPVIVHNNDQFPDCLRVDR
ncbi:hypothetical protein [Sphaerospermopsis sp. FACHB-1194]|nr:hypothetical protein [Sphaerospermopsis sp. FACHB-1194]